MVFKDGVQQPYPAPTKPKEEIRSRIRTSTRRQPSPSPPRRQPEFYRAAASGVAPGGGGIDTKFSMDSHVHLQERQPVDLGTKEAAPISPRRQQHEHNRAADSSAAPAGCGNDTSLSVDSRAHVQEQQPVDLSSSEAAPVQGGISWQESFGRWAGKITWVMRTFLDDPQEEKSAEHCRCCKEALPPKLGWRCTTEDCPYSARNIFMCSPTNGGNVSW